MWIYNWDMWDPWWIFSQPQWWGYISWLLTNTRGGVRPKNVLETKHKVSGNFSGEHDTQWIRGSLFLVIIVLKKWLTQKSQAILFTRALCGCPQLWYSPIYNKFVYGMIVSKLQDTGLSSTPVWNEDMSNVLNETLPESSPQHITRFFWN